MFYGAVSDFFAQAVISFMLGQRNLGVFNEFLENLESTDHSALMQQSRVRAAASEFCMYFPTDGSRNQLRASAR